MPEWTTFLPDQAPTAAQLNAMFNQVRYGSDSINVMNYGCIGDGTVDDTTAFLSAVSACSSGDCLYVPPGFIFKTSSTITVPAGIDVIMDSPIKFHGNSDDVIIVVGSADAANTNRSLKLQVYRNSQSNWSTEDSIGIQVINAYASRIEVVRSDYSCVGLHCIGTGGRGFGYNTVNLGTLWDCKIGLKLEGYTSGTGGWCNENLFLGGRFANDPTKNPTLARYGIVLTSNATYTNNNVFIKPSFEIGLSGVTGEVICIDCREGYYNHAYDCRCENAALTYFAQFSGTSAENHFYTGYYNYAKSKAKRTVTGTPGSNFVYLCRTIHHDREHPTVYNTGHLLKNIVKYANDYWQMENITFIKYSDGAFSDKYYYEGNAIKENYVYLSSSWGAGFWVDTQKAKKFILKKDVDEATPGTVCMKCFDANNNELTDLMSGDPYIAHDITTSFEYWSTRFNGCYEIGSESDNDFFFELSNDVKKIFIFVHGECNLRSLSLICLDNYSPACWTGKENKLGNTIIEYPNLLVDPTGTFDRAERFYNNTPAAGGNIGWVCITAGTLGTLNGSGTTGTIKNGATALVVNSLTDLKIGDYITIAGVSGTKQVVSKPTALASTTVDATSSSGQAVVNVAATTNFAVGERVVMEGGGNTEYGFVASIQAGVSITLTANLTNTFSAGHTVKNVVTISSASDANVSAAAVAYSAPVFKKFGTIES